MTLAELRTSVRNLTKEWSDDSGTLFPSDNTILDFFITWAAEDVVLDLVEFMPEDFLTYEDISLVANQSEYDLTAEWISIWSMQKKVTDESYRDIPYIPISDRRDYVGETQADPSGWFLKGTTITFWPTPSAAKTDYARCWIVAPEAAGITMVPDPDTFNFTINSINKYIDIDKGVGDTEYTATLTEGRYTGATLATEIKTQLDAMGGVPFTFTVTYTATTGKFTIQSATGAWNILWKTGVHGSDNTGNNVGILLGFNDLADDSGSASYVSDNAASRPVRAPRMAHKLIPLQAAILIGYMNDREVGNIVALYKIQKDRVIDSLTNRVQQQPQFLRPSVYSRISGDRRDKAFYDKGSPFER